MNRAGVTVEVKNWPVFFPIIHHDITNEIPIHAQKLQYTAFASWLGLIVCLIWNMFSVLIESVHSNGAKFLLIQSIIVTVHVSTLMYFLICRHCPFSPCCHLCNIWMSSFIYTVVQASLPCDEVTFHAIISSNCEHTMPYEYCSFEN
ncbi:hypothetical protein PR202_ga30646 [Eleusine coracana subsp. coracana]|uniref:Secretory carrier-associated membrane protein n=1 Tax=Eleusine coracana subsp. coracana TaxID=191504 RepID=A0AAV5DMX7_ELECO|nr:hypothetical protein PR202_ga30646 [Eleusine coracana subsp. coracana]